MILRSELSRRLKSSSIIDHISYEEAYGTGFEDMDRRVPDIAKAHKWFGYAPSHSLADMIVSVVDYYRNKESGQSKSKRPSIPFPMHTSHPALPSAARLR